MTKPSQNNSIPESRSLKSRQLKGIRKRKWGKWVSEIRMPNSTARIWLVSYDTPEKAARAYDFAAYYLRGTNTKLNYPDCPPEIPNTSFLSPSQIQFAAAKFTTGEFRPPSEDGAASSSFRVEVKCGIDDQQIATEQGGAIPDSAPLERLDSGESLNVEDIPPLDVSMTDFGILFHPTEEWGTGDV